MNVRVLRHVAFEDLGLLGPLLVSRGAAIETVDVSTADVAALDPLAPDLLVVLGGPLGANDAGRFPFIEAGIEALGARLAAGRPTLGICLGRLGVDEPVVLHWHGDNFELPPGAERLAWTGVCPEQAFALGDHALGLQFHLDVPAADLERWLVGHVVEIGSARGVSVADLRADTAHFGPALEHSAPAVFSAWLDGCGPGAPQGTGSQ